MIRVLLVDDDASKSEEVTGLILGACKNGSVDIQRARNAFQAAQAMTAERFDLVILDILLPPREGKEPATDGGMRVLRELRRGTGLKLPMYIVGLTAFPEVAEKYDEEFGEGLWRLIRYSRSEEAWRNGLRNLLNHMEAIEESRAQAECDLCVVTALHLNELDAVLRIDCGWQREPEDSDPAIYSRGSLQSAEGDLSIVTASAPQMGMCASTTLAVKMIERFRPRVIAMVGIAAGVEGNFGDVLVADQAWDYGAGKLVDQMGTQVLEPAPSPIPLDPFMKYDVAWFQRESQPILNEIFEAWDGLAAESEPVMRVGPVASGAAVVGDRRRLEEILGHNRKLIGVDMEAYGVFYAAQFAREPRPQVPRPPLLS